MKLDKFIFDHFAPIPFKQWKQKIQYELNGADYQTELVKTSFNGITHLPFYTHSENRNLIDIKAPKRALKTVHITVFNALEANNEALKYQNTKAEAFYFLIFDKEIDSAALLKDIQLPVIIDCQFLNVKLNKEIHKNYKGTALKILTTPFGKLLKTGNWFRDNNWDIEQLQHIISFNNEALTINLSVLHNAGASEIQQLSYTICQILEYKKVINLNNCKTINYQVSIGTDFYVEIAKIKALRVLHFSITKWLNITIEPNIILLKSHRNLQAVNTNLNSSIHETEQLIGIAGGANYITSLPNNSCFFKEDSGVIEDQITGFLNSDIHEKAKLFDNTIYIEKLTQQLVSKSIELINSIEEGGGFLVQFKKGIIHKKIEQKAIQEQRKFNENWDNLITEKSLLNKTPVSYPFFKYSDKKTQYKPLIEKRLSAPLEKSIWDNIYKND